MDAEDILIFTEDILQKAETYKGELYSIEAVKLLMGTAAAETRFNFIYQIDGPARSFWQVRPDVAEDNFANFLNLKQLIDLKARIIKTCRINYILFEYNPGIEIYEDLLTQNLAFALLMARITYLRVAEKIPGAMYKLAQFWIDHYNPEGNPGQFIAAYEHFIKPL